MGRGWEGGDASLNASHVTGVEDPENKARGTSVGVYFVLAKVHKACIESYLTEESESLTLTLRGSEGENDPDSPGERLVITGAAIYEVLGFKWILSPSGILLSRESVLAAPGM